MIQRVHFAFVYHNKKILGNESFTRWLVWSAITNVRDSTSTNDYVFASILPENS